MSGGQNPLAYGRSSGGQDEESPADGGDRGLSDTARGFLSDGLKRFKDQYSSGHGGASQQQQGSSYSGLGSGPGYQSGSSNQADVNNSPQYLSRPLKQDKLSSLLNKFEETVSDVGAQLAQKIGTTIDADAYAGYGPSNTAASKNRFGSFAPPRENNDVKWHVDGFTYFWAVSRALETARDSIWILDWWLSPELYLRRPPAKNEQYRLDRMLQAAAQRGVKVNIIVYKEVEAALSLSSIHTKHALEALHPNIAVFRHPDHIPDVADIRNSLTASFQNLTLDAAAINKMPGDTLKALYGSAGDTVLYWAHHEKLCLIDGRIAFMGGLDLCFGRWDTNQHSIADVHPSDLSQIMFPGQDYNNARVLDFQNVSHWQENQLDRKRTGRMGWSDISISLRGPVVEDLRKHFVDRWNYIYETKYRSREQPRYQRLELYRRLGGPQSQGNTHPNTASSPQPQPAPPNQGQLGSEPHWQQTYTQPVQQQSGQSYYQSPPLEGQQSSYPSGNQYNTPPPGQYYPGHGQQLPPPPTQLGQSNFQPLQSQWHDESQSGNQSYYPPPPPNQGYQAQNPPHSNYSTTGNVQSPGQYYPPPPPGPPPSQIDNSSHSGQHSGPSYPTSQPGYDTSPYASHNSTPAQAPYFPPPPVQDFQSPQTQSGTRGLGEEDVSRGAYSNQAGYSGTGRSTTQNVLSDVRGFGHSLRGQLAGQVHQYQDRYITNLGRSYGNQSCQLVRSASKWSADIPTEHSIQNAYIGAIRNSRHFLYIENQFFITATGDHQKPVQNKIGAALVERILEAARARQKYKVIVVIPSVPGFAGDLRDDSSLGTRAIMEYQYNSINRGGNSIMELIAKEGFNPMDYIRFYNLRNYDRINMNSTMLQAESASGMSYEDARRAHDAEEVGYRDYTPAKGYDTTQSYEQYQQAANAYPSTTSSRWDTVSECYMLDGQDIRNVPWDSDLPEIDAFITEELYIHSKVLIADDRIVICGSANLNDRSQLGTHDSEIALVIDDHTPLESTMDGQPWQASRFAASLRRELTRKHLGLLRAQDYTRPNANCEPAGVPNEFDPSSPESQVVADPLSDTFQSLWNSRARTNTEVFRKVFNVVPDDYVRNWEAYKEFFEYNFRKADYEAEGKRITRPSKYEWGHVVRDNFAPGPEGAKQVKEQLSQVKGTLVEMPLMFLIEEEIAKEGLTLNALTEEIYT